MELYSSKSKERYIVTSAMYDLSRGGTGLVADERTVIPLDRQQQFTRFKFYNNYSDIPFAAKDYEQLNESGETATTTDAYLWKDVTFNKSELSIKLNGYAFTPSKTGKDSHSLEFKDTIVLPTRKWVWNDSIYLQTEGPKTSGEPGPEIDLKGCHYSKESE